MPIDLQILSSLEAIRLPVLDQIFLFITDIGIAPFLLPFFCLIYWNLNKKAGEFLAFSFFLTMLTNQLLKITFCIDRPWVRNPDMNPVDAAIPAATGYSFPSGHTSNTTAIFGGIGLWFKNRLLRILCFVIIALVAFSRLYLGVHTPEDVLVAMIIGFSAIFVSKKLLECMNELSETCEKFAYLGSYSEVI